MAKAKKEDLAATPSPLQGGGSQGRGGLATSVERKGSLALTADTARDPTNATLLYELVR